MREQITQELSRLENEFNFKIIYAVESGSRAWGFASKDSDWDVRFIYLHDLNWYLSIDDRKDSFEEILPNDIDLSGWEFRKTLKLFKKSNPQLLEWLQSPIVYNEQSSIIEKLRELVFEYFNPKACLYHYLHMAEGNFREYLQRENVRVKKYFYVLRPILACQWIENENTMPPIEFRKLVDSQLKVSELKNEIENLLIRKINGEELNTEPKIKVINDYLIEKLNYYNNFSKQISEKKQIDTSKLNELFRTALAEIK